MDRPSRSRSGSTKRPALLGLPGPAPPPPPEWLAAEPGGRALVADLRRLYRRNRAAPLPLLVLVIAGTLWGLRMGYQYRPSYEARIALRLTEHDVGIGARPRPAAALREFVTDVALSDRRLIQIIERFNLYPQRRLIGMDQAVESLREDVGVDVWRNEFLSEEEEGGLGRSARVALSYSHKDPEVAFGVVSALAEATIDEQRRMRKAQVEYLALGLEPAIAATEMQLRELQVEDAARGGASTLVRMDHNARVEELTHSLNELRQLQEEAALRVRAESANLGLETQIIDTVRPQARPYHARATALGAGAGFLVGLLLGGMTIKAFDRRIYDEEDLLRLGYPVCGALPPFPGDHVGSMNQRTRMTS